MTGWELHSFMSDNLISEQICQMQALSLSCEICHAAEVFAFQ